MLSFFVDAVTLALPLGLTWGALAASTRWNDRGRDPRGLLLASGAGAVLALLLSVLRQMTNWVNREQITLALVVVWLLLAAALVVRLWRAPLDPSQPADKAAGLLSAGLGGVLLLIGLPEVMLLTIGFLTPGGSPFSTETVLNVAGYSLGLVVVAASVLAGSRAARGARRRAARIGLTTVLAVAMASQATTLMRILLGRRLVKPPSWLFQSVVWLVNHEVWFTYALMAMTFVPITAAWLRHGSKAHPEPANPAQRRLYRAAGVSRRRLIITAAVGFGVAVAATTVGRGIVDAEPSLSPPEPLESDADEVWVELSSIEDGHLHRFAYQTTDQTEVRFIAIKKNAKAFGVALDACNVCGPSGYFERGGQVICKLCDVAMNIATIGLKGGCNPVPLEFTVRDARLVVARSALEASAGVFS